MFVLKTFSGLKDGLIAFLVVAIAALLVGCGIQIVIEAIRRFIPSKDDPKPPFKIYEDTDGGPITH